MNSSSVFPSYAGIVVRRSAKYLIVALIGLSLLTTRGASAKERSFAYVVTTNSQFGVVDITTGAFHQIGADTPEPLVNLVWWKESLLSVSVSGNLSKVNPKTGEVTVIGATGLGFNV